MRLQLLTNIFLLLIMLPSCGRIDDQARSAAKSQPSSSDSLEVAASTVGQFWKMGEACVEPMGDKLGITDCTEKPSKLWILNFSSVDDVTIKNVGSNRCLTINRAENGSPLTLANCKNLATQMFKYHYGDVVFIDKYCADLNVKTPSMEFDWSANVINLWECTGTWNQKWHFDYPKTMPAPTNKSTSISPSHPRVVVLGIDGMGSENVWRGQKQGVRAPNVPNLNRIRGEGVASLNAKIDEYNYSGPNWMGIITGSSSKKHGVTTNKCERGNTMPTIYELLRAQRPNAVIGIVHEWEMIPCHTDRSKVQHIVKTGKANATADAVINLWKTASPDFLFVQFDEVDHAGHNHGGTSNEYVGAVETVDAAIGRIYAAIAQSPAGASTYIMVVSDHGMGEGGNHASHTAPVPLFVAGPGLSHADLKESVYNRHVAPFAAYLLGLKPAPEWETTAAPLAKYATSKP